MSNNFWLGNTVTWNCLDFSITKLLLRPGHLHVRQPGRLRRFLRRSRNMLCCLSTWFLNIVSSMVYVIKLQTNLQTKEHNLFRGVTKPWDHWAKTSWNLSTKKDHGQLIWTCTRRWRLNAARIVLKFQARVQGQLLCRQQQKRFQNLLWPLVSFDVLVVAVEFVEVWSIFALVGFVSLEGMAEHCRFRLLCWSPMSRQKWCSEDFKALRNFDGPTQKWPAIFDASMLPPPACKKGMSIQNISEIIQWNAAERMLSIFNDHSHYRCCHEHLSRGFMRCFL